MGKSIFRCDFWSSTDFYQRLIYNRINVLWNTNATCITFHVVRVGARFLLGRGCYKHVLIGPAHDCSLFRFPLWRRVPRTAVSGGRNSGPARSSSRAFRQLGQGTSGSHYCIYVLFLLAFYDLKSVLLPTVNVPVDYHFFFFLYVIFQICQGLWTRRVLHVVEYPEK